MAVVGGYPETLSALDSDAMIALQALTALLACRHACLTKYSSRPRRWTTLRAMISPSSQMKKASRGCLRSFQSAVNTFGNTFDQCQGKSSTTITPSANNATSPPSMKWANVWE